MASRTRPVSGALMLVRRNVYVLPTRAGLLFGCAMAAMLLATINYSLSLGYMLTFMLVALALVSMLHTYRNLAGLVLQPGRVEPVFAADVAEFGATLRNTGRAHRYALRFDVPGLQQQLYQDVAAHSENLVALALPTARRGWLPVPRIRISTGYPLGLWRAWSYWQPDLKVLVLAQPESPPVPLPSGTGDAHARQNSAAGDDEPAGVRPYRDGDPLRRMAWKAMARNPAALPMTLLFDGDGGGQLVLRWSDLPVNMDVEQRLSRLTRWVLDADAVGMVWTLELPGHVQGPDGGPLHRHLCLELLATHGLPLQSEARR